MHGNCIFQLNLVPRYYASTDAIYRTYKMTKPYIQKQKLTHVFLLYRYFNKPLL